MIASRKISSTILVMMIFSTELLIPKEGYTQPRVNIPSSAGCNGEDLLVPVRVENFFDITALTLHITLEKSKVTFLDVDNIHPALKDGNIYTNYQDEDSVLSFVW